jgi:methylaspartate ammonia-lyase
MFDRYHDVDKMIVRRAASLPDTLLDNIHQHFGEDGKILRQYIRWLSERIRQLGGVDYHPTIHLNVHGGLGLICQNNLGGVLGQLYALEEAAQPYPLRIVSPVLMDRRQDQIESFKKLCQYTRIRNMEVKIVADEWADNFEDISAFIAARSADMIHIKAPKLGCAHHAVDAVLACKANEMGAFIGGSCVETDLSARVSVHIALATRADIVMAMPAKSIDEAMMFTQNEMARSLASIASRV